MIKKIFHSTSANALTHEALRLLRLKGYYVWRQNNAGIYDPVKKIFRRNSATKGIPDIIGFHRKTSQFIACEIKAGTDRLSEEQKNFLNHVRIAGGIAIVIRNSDDLVKIISV